MILQLKITVADFAPTIFRTVQVQEELTFDQLGDLIHIAFDLDEVESYLFDIQQVDGKKVDETYIGIDYDNDFLIDEELILDDEDELLSDWFMKIGDNAIFILANYEFEFHIEVEKILPPQTSQTYPLCTAAQGVVPSLKEQVSSVDSEQLVEETNAILSELDFLFEETSDTPDWEALFEAADTLKKLKPWHYLAVGDIFVVEDPITSELLYCSVLGEGGQEFGLTVYVGEEGRAILDQLLAGNMTTNLYYSMRCISVSYADRNELSNVDYQLIKDTGLSFRGKKNWIQFRSFEPGLFPWIPDEMDAMLLLTAIEQTIEIVQQLKNGWSFPRIEEPDTFLIRHMHIDEDDITWMQSVGQVESHDDMDEEPLYFDLSEFELAKLKKLPKMMQNIEFDLFYLPEAVQEEPDERPFYPVFIGAIDPSSGMVIYQNVLSLQKDGISAQGELLSFIQVINTLPKTLCVTPEVARFLAPLATQLGITLIATKPLLEMEQLKDSLYTEF